jgi:putative ABC transport system substrate-binding protein
MKRREFISLLGGIAAWPLAAPAQQAERMPRIGVLTLGGEAVSSGFLRAFRAGMTERGYQDGKNVRFEVRHSDMSEEKLRRNARELVATNVDLIWVPGTVGARAAREATATIPIVFAMVSDPIYSGFVRSLASPGTNMTGMSLLLREMWGKRLEILFEVRAEVQRLGVLSQSSDPSTAANLSEIRTAAARFGKELLVVEANSTEEFSPAFGRLKEWRADALVIMETALFLTHRRRLFNEATTNLWPTVNSTRQYAEAGGLISYGVDYFDNSRRSALYVDRILKGTRPADLPVQQPTKFELVINLGTAKALDLEIPATLLARADEVIE